MSIRETHDTAVAAACSGISRATAFRIDADPRLPSQKAVLRTRRRPDPLAAINSVYSDGARVPRDHFSRSARTDARTTAP